VTTEPPRRRPATAVLTAPPSPPVAEPSPPAARPDKTAREPRPFLLDFFPLETEKDTRLARFFERLRGGRLSTTRCPRDQLLLWPPRTACPVCHTDQVEWVDLPERGRIYAFSAVLAGAPMGMESEVPFSVGLVDLEGVPLRLFGRIEGRPWSGLRIGLEVRVESYDIGDGRFFYRFRTLD
jgi:uncharacterized protein